MSTRDPVTKLPGSKRVGYCLQNPISEKKVKENSAALKSDKFLLAHHNNLQTQPDLVFCFSAVRWCLHHHPFHILFVSCVAYIPLLYMYTWICSIQMQKSLQARVKSSKWVPLACRGQFFPQLLSRYNEDHCK